MTPILYNSSCTTKVAFLNDCESCIVTEERNGAYTLEMTYPVAGEYFSSLSVDLCIKAKANQTSENQFFRIVEITKPLDGLVTIYANHISYDLSGYPIEIYFTGSAVTADTAISGILGIANQIVPNNFSLAAGDNPRTAKFACQTCSARAALGGTEGSILDTYGGEFEFNNFKVKLHNNRGKNNGVRIAYGKNLVGMELQLNTENSYTGIFPFAFDDDVLITLPEVKISVPNDSGIADKILMMDFSSVFDEDHPATEANLRTAATTYLNDNDINAIGGSMKVEMIDLSKTSAYDMYSALEAVNLCDTVKVVHKKLGVSTSMKVVKTVYNTLSERYDSLELGTPRSGFADTLQAIQSTAEEARKRASESTSQLEYEFQQAILDATQAITGASGGHVVLNPSRNPQEILILQDTDNLETAQKLWRWNIAGLAYSTNGYDGPYNTALLGEDGKLVINEITARLISANLIRAGAVVSTSGDMILNLDDSTLTSGATGSTRSIFQAGHIDFYYGNRFSYRLGQDANRSMTIEDENSNYCITINPHSKVVRFNNNNEINIEIDSKNGYQKFSGGGKNIYFDGANSGILYGSPGDAAVMMQISSAKNLVIGSTSTSKINSVNYYSQSGTGHNFIVGSGNTVMTMLRNGIYCYEDLYVHNVPVRTSSAGETQTVDSSMIESDIMDYFENSTVLISPETTYETAATTNQVIDEEGNIIEEEIPATSETVRAHAELINDIPEILQSTDGDGIDIYSMASLMWEAIKNLNARVKELEEELNGTQN